jgi:hypothetical protein
MIAKRTDTNQNNIYLVLCTTGSRYRILYVAKKSTYSDKSQEVHQGMIDVITSILQPVYGDMNFLYSFICCSTMKSFNFIVKAVRDHELSLSCNPLFNPLCPKLFMQRGFSCDNSEKN